jgi:hypothetical protein
VSCCTLLYHGTYAAPSTPPSRNVRNSSAVSSARDRLTCECALLGRRRRRRLVQRLLAGRGWRLLPHRRDGRGRERRLHSLAGEGGLLSARRLRRRGGHRGGLRRPGGGVRRLLAPRRVVGDGRGLRGDGAGGRGLCRDSADGRGVGHGVRDGGVDGGCGGAARRRGHTARRGARGRGDRRGAVLVRGEGRLLAPHGRRVGVHRRHGCVLGRRLGGEGRLLAADRLVVRGGRRARDGVRARSGPHSNCPPDSGAGAQSEALGKHCVMMRAEGWCGVGYMRRGANDVIGHYHGIDTAWPNRVSSASSANALFASACLPSARDVNCAARGAEAASSEAGAGAAWLDEWVSLNSCW